MISVDFLKDGITSILINKSLYQNEMIEILISDFIENKEEIQELLRRHPEKKKKYYGFLIFAFLDVKLQQLHNDFIEKSEEGVKYCFINQCEGMTPRQISRYKRKINKFLKNVFGDSIDSVNQILIKGSNIEEMLELVFLNEKIYHNMLKFLNGQMGN